MSGHGDSLLPSCSHSRFSSGDIWKIAVTVFASVVSLLFYAWTIFKYLYSPKRTKAYRTMIRSHFSATAER